MKKAILKALSLFIFCVFALSMGFMSISADDAVPGDVNNDGEITIFDVLFITKAVVNGTALENSDVNGDGKTNLLDVINAIRIIATGETPEVGEEEKTTADIVVENGTVKEAVSINGEKVSAAVPEGVAVEDGTTELSLSVSAMDSTNGNITAGETEDVASYDVHIEGVSKENTVAIIVDLGAILPVGQNAGTVALYHVENGKAVKMTQVMSLAELDEHNEFYYYPATGNVYVALATFSEIVLANDTVNAWQGKFDYSWYTEPQTLAENNDADYVIANADQLAAFGAIVGGMAEGIEQDSFAGKTVKLIADINIGDDEANNREGIIFYPIGYNSDDGLYEKTGVAVSTGFYSFMGTFDGNGNTISNIYQNTWEMKGDHNWYDAELQYFRDGMGIFGKVYGGTVKNLIVENFSSDGEITTTGVIAAYADCGATFENISIFNCNPRVYNIGNGGIVGCAGWYTKEVVTTPITFRNITVDQTNKISALWGSWGVSCGGILGQYYPESGQSSANYPKNAGVHFENCHVAAIIDVNNDVCSNYQYYWYRYAGMLMGTVRKNTIDSDGYTVADTTDITAVDCTYTMGDWNEYWYCELVKNTLASYTHDHQFSRLDKIESLSEIQDENGNWNKEGNFVIPNADNTAAECYHIFTNSEGKLYQHFHDVADESNPEIYETFDLNGDGELNDLKEDRQRYYIPFGQILTGLDMGVKPTYEFDGVTEVVGGATTSFEKFAQKEDAVLTYTPGEAIKLGDFLKATVDESKISMTSLFATVSPATENDTVSATYAIDLSDWTKGTLTFTADSTGTAKVVITDYFYCTPTVIYLAEKEAATPVDKFVAKDNLTFTHTDENGAIEKTLGDIFASVEGVEIDSAAVEVTVTEGCTYTKNDSDWTQSTLSFTGTDTVTITITDGELCNTATATVTITEPERVEKFVAKDNLTFTHTIDSNVVVVVLGDIFGETGNATIDSGKVSVETTGAYTANTTDWTQGTITFTGAGEYTVTITDNNYCIATTATVTITEPEPVEKFALVFENTDKYLYRVGNADKSPVKLSSLFKLVDDTIPLGTVSVTVESVDDTIATGTYTADATWTNGTIKFNGTGVVKVTITDDMYCIPTELLLEVVDAVNATTATNATSNNVVLLNDIGGGFTVSGRYTVYGNGFTLNYTGNGQYLNNGLKQGIITVSENGTLDNLRIKATIYPKAYLYYGTTLLGDYVQGGPSTVEGDKTRYHYQLSAVVAKGNATISNCYIYGGRANIFVDTGDVTVKDTILECGTVANAQIQSTSEYTVTFENVTTIQHQVNATIVETSAVMLGAGILVGPDTTSNPTIVLNGDFKQYNWVTSDDANAVSDTKITKAIIQGALDATAYNHTVNGKTASNLGIIYMNTEDVTVTNNTGLPYVPGMVTMTMSNNKVEGQVCSLQNATEEQIYSDYKNADRTTVNGDYMPTFEFDLGDQEISYDGSEDTRYLYGDADGVAALYQDGDDPLTLDLSKLATIYKYSGLNYEYSAVCKNYSGNNLTATNNVVTLDAQGDYTLEFTVIDDIFYDENGNPINKSVERTFTVPLNLTVKEADVKNAVVNITKTALDGVYTTVNLTDYKLRINFLDCISVTDYDNKGTGTTVALTSNISSATLTPASVNVFTTAYTATINYTDGRVLTVNFSKISGSSPGTKTATINTSGGLYFITDGALDNKPTEASSQNICTITSVSYKGNSGSEVTNDTDVTVTWALGSSSGCFAEGTLITLADGTQKPIEQITFEDELLAWDFNTGTYVTTTPSLIDTYKAIECRVINLTFADGTVVRMVVDHGFFDVEANNFVFLSEENVASYVGHEFVKVSENGAYETTRLIDYEITEEVVSYYAIQTAIYNNCIAENMFTLTSPPEMLESEGWFDYFEIGEGMKYDEAKMNADIEKYGLYEYDDFAEYVTYEQFIAFNGPYLKVLVGRGVVTYEQIIELISIYVTPQE